MTNKIFLYTDGFDGNHDFVDKVVESVPYSSEIGYAGYSERPGLYNFLKWLVFGKTCAKWETIDSKEVMKEIRKTLDELNFVINERTINIFVFPTVDEFVIKEMDGVSGFSAWKNTILIGIYPSHDWRSHLRNTICHELAHAISLNFIARKTLLDDLIFEGVAEHFREKIIGGKSKWVNTVDRAKCKKILSEISDKMNDADDKLYADLFYGTGKYPRWAGYSIGYHIVDSYLNNKKDIDWISIFMTNPADIMAKYKVI